MSSFSSSFKKERTKKKTVAKGQSSQITECRLFEGQTKKRLDTERGLFLMAYSIKTGALSPPRSVNDESAFSFLRARRRMANLSQLFNAFVSIFFGKMSLLAELSCRCTFAPSINRLISRFLPPSALLSFHRPTQCSAVQPVVDPSR